MSSPISLLSNVVPQSILYQAYIRKQRFLHRSFLGENFQCNICRTHLKRFISLAEIADGLFIRDLLIKGKKHRVNDYETLNLQHFLCPICGSQDKARLYELFVTEQFRTFQPKKKTYTFIHFAPEGGLPQRIKHHTFLNYKTADLLRDDVDLHADLTDLKFKDNSVDFFICSHILEHIPQDSLALRELYRVLNPGGWGILTVPILSTLAHTYEDATKVSDEERLKHFGQADHVRVYAKSDFLKKLKQTGFYVREYTSTDFATESFERLGITNSSVLYVVSKSPLKGIHEFNLLPT